MWDKFVCRFDYIIREFHPFELCVKFPKSKVFRNNFQELKYLHILSEMFTMSRIFRFVVLYFDFRGCPSENELRYLNAFLILKAKYGKTREVYFRRGSNL